VAVRCAFVRVWVPVVTAVALTLAGCGSGDSTVAKTPEPTTTKPATTSVAASPPPPKSAPTSSAAPAADPCSVNLAAPEIARAASGLPRDPRSGQGWNPEPIAGNYNKCAQLSAVIIKANTNASSPNTRAIMFHQGKFIPTGVPDTFGFNGMDTSQSTGDTIALKYSNGIAGLDSIVRFRWNGSGVELIGNVSGG
jgi:LppP/LprE lipoprotein